MDGAKRLHELLDNYSIAHDFDIYEGDHVNRIHARLATRMMPFFNAHLEFQR